MNHTILQEGKVIGRYYYDGVNVGFISFFPKIDVNTHTVGLKKQIGVGLGWLHTATLGYSTPWKTRLHP